MSQDPEELPLVLFRISCVLGVFISGFFAHANQVWPYSLITNGAASIHELIADANAYVGLAPTRHLYPVPGTDSGVTRNEPGKTGGGLVFLAGIFGEGNAMRLIADDGREVHRWDVSYFSLFPDLGHIEPVTSRPMHDLHTLIHGAQPLPDGSVVFNFDMFGSARIDRCGKPMWQLARQTNHSVTLAEDGTLWIPSRVYHTKPVDRLPMHRPPFYEDQLLQIGQDGTVLKEISLPGLMLDNGLAGLLFPGGDKTVGSQFDDSMHVNDAEVLSSDKAAAFPMFAAGDIAVSMRQLNLIVVFDPRSLKVKWHQAGPWLRQHDPDFLADGTISIFDNRTDNTISGDVLKGSAITKIDPKSREMKLAYVQDANATDARFYTFIMGKHQYQDNGNLLISQPTFGRALEVDGSGRVVWEYINRHDTENVALMTEATRYPESYFKVTDWTCKPEGTPQ